MHVNTSEQILIGERAVLRPTNDVIIERSQQDMPRAIPL
jgi:hypothetical protein